METFQDTWHAQRVKIHK
jgi:hypothetical protein